VSALSPDALVHGSGEFWLKADLRVALDLKNPDGAGRFRSSQNAGTTDAALSAKRRLFAPRGPGASSQRRAGRQRDGDVAAR
jgi:hypothetical protein